MTLDAPMSQKYAALRDAATEIAVTDPHLMLLGNADGAAVTTGKEWLERVVAQVATPVRWDLCTETLREHNVTAIVEFPPAGTLTGIAKRELRGVTARAVKSPADLDELANL